MSKTKVKKEKKSKVAQPNKLGRFLMQMLVEGKCMKSAEQRDKNKLSCGYTIQPQDFMHPLGKELDADKYAAQTQISFDVEVTTTLVSKS